MAKRLVVKWKARFVKEPRRRELHLKTFFGASIEHVSQQIQSFVAVKEDKGWKLMENEIVSITTQEV